MRDNLSCIIDNRNNLSLSVIFDNISDGTNVHDIINIKKVKYAFAILERAIL